MNMRVQAPDGSEYTSTMFGWQLSKYPSAMTARDADIEDGGKCLFHGLWITFLLPPVGIVFMIVGLWHLIWSPRARKERRWIRKAQRQAVAEAEQITATA